MKVTAINGSPRQNGNTFKLLQTVLEPLAIAGWETEIVQLAGKKIAGCKACGQCGARKDKKCVFDNDGFNEVFAKMAASDAIIIGSPTYFADVTAETKALIDRAGFVAMMNDCLFAGKIGAAVVALRRGGGVRGFDTINHLFLISQMIVPGSTYWNIGFGLEAGAVSSDSEGLANMTQLGQAVDLLGKAAAGAASPYPVRKEGES